MNYFIKREIQEYGPYSLAELQKYVASGNISMNDLCRSEGMTEFVPVSQVLGNIPVPPPVAPPAPTPTPVAAPMQAAGGVYSPVAPVQAAGGVYAPVAPAVSQYPAPPNLHWAIVLLICIFTCFLFGWVWLFIEAAWVKKVQPASKAIVYLAIALVLAFVGGAMNGLPDSGVQGFGRLMSIASWVLLLIGVFDMKSSIEQHYNTAEPIGLRLSGVMTFFFALFYFQYHFSRINEMRQRPTQGYAR